MFIPSARAQILTRRTYNREISPGLFETWEDTVDRVIRHQKWLWQRARGYGYLSPADEQELHDLRSLFLDRKALPAGRTLWLGGTQVAQTREASQFNCSFLRIENVRDVVDAFWLLLQGCGVGFEPVVGTLSGFTQPVTCLVIPGRSDYEKGRERNQEAYEDGAYRLVIGDSAQAWSKAVGKLLALKEPVSRVILDCSQLRGPGMRLAGYGWISSGFEPYARALEAICGILSARAGQLLTRLDILDILNHLGTTLSTRRSAEIALCPYSDPHWQDFALAKKDHWTTGNPQRAQSNNSLMFYSKPNRGELYDLFDMIELAGGSEPGFVNAEAALRRAPWFKGVNPCAEILLGNKSFCNLVEVDLGKFVTADVCDDWYLVNAMALIARANYRQTCVNLNDGILQDSWHQLNQFLRLCGTGITGISRWLSGDNPLDAYRLQRLREAAREGAFSMADELGLPRPQAVTTVKPSGTLSKIMDTTEGAHTPLGNYIFNNIRFSNNDPALRIVEEAGYHIFQDPYDSGTSLVRCPVSYPDISFGDGYYNKESAVSQLERYKLLMDNYVDHNCSITVSYSRDEVPSIVRWIDKNWDNYVGVSFLYRVDPTKTAVDLGYPYLPQEVVDPETFNEYVRKLKPVDLDGTAGFNESDELVFSDGCVGGVCPVR